MTPAAVAIAYILLDVKTGAVVRAEWPEMDRPVPVGSLLKPFTALAYAQAHQFQYPRVECRKCWSGRVHGVVDIRQAVAVSCNSYFLKLAEQLTADGADGVAARFGLPPPTDATPAARVGLGGDWSAAPEAVLRAYAELAARRAEPGLGPLLDGMRLSARSGTGKGIGLDALVKTGTAACVHRTHAPGDGYAVALYPAASPRWAVLVQVHSKPGAAAAEAAGRLLRQRS